jgi:hypothetical protein
MSHRNHSAKKQFSSIALAARWWKRHRMTRTFLALALLLALMTSASGAEPEFLQKYSDFRQQLLSQGLVPDLKYSDGTTQFPEVDCGLKICRGTWVNQNNQETTYYIWNRGANRELYILTPVGTD